MALNKNNDIYSKIEKSDSDSSTKYDIKDSLRTANDIVKKVQTKNPLLSEKFKNEYINLENSIIESLKIDNKITVNELVKIKFELWNIQKQAKQNHIDWFYDKKIDYKEINKIKNININNYSIEQAKLVLVYLNKKYQKYDEANYLEKAITWKNNNIDSLDDKYEVNIFQDKLIKIIFNNSNWFNKNQIHWYNNTVWNYIITKNSFEDEIWKRNDIQALNWTTFWNYLNKLENEQNLNYEYLSNKFDESKANKILNFKFKWEDNKSNTFKWHLKRIFNSIKKYFSKLFEWDFITFEDKITNFSESNKEKLFKQIEKNPKDRENLIKRDITYLSHNPVKINKIHNKLLIKSLEESIKDWRVKLINIFKKAWWKKEKIDSFLEKIEKKQFNSAVDLVVFIKEIQKEDPTLNDTNIQTITWTIIKSKTNSSNIKTIKSKKTPEEKKQEIKKNKTKEIIFDTIISNKDAITQIMYSKWTDYNTIMTNVIKNNAELRNQLKDIEFNYEYWNNETNILDKYLGKEINDLIKENYYFSKYNENEETKTIKYPNWEELTYTKFGDIYNIDNWKEGNVWIDITEKEFLEIKESPEAKKNLITFHDFFIKEVNLPIVWEKREEILIALWNNNIQNDWNSIQKSELRLIANGILELIYWKTSDINLQSAKKTLNEFSEHKSELSDQKKYWLRWVWKLEKLMIDNKILVNWKFNTETFREAKKTWLINKREKM